MDVKCISHINTKSCYYLKLSAIINGFMLKLEQNAYIFSNLDQCECVVLVSANKSRRPLHLTQNAEVSPTISSRYLSTSRTSSGSFPPSEVTFHVPIASLSIWGSGR
ncbi:hypothetical protein XENOCAPTIV_010077 [Xenoophorus captivus]|uniref:Uncharacterized protein n=1 Tax=Xenoophorus captivus TaxID=1517983 RepID=A0ABV0QR14_9TELE